MQHDAPFIKSFFAFEKCPIDIDRVKLIPTQHILQSQVYEAITPSMSHEEKNGSPNLIRNYPLLECIARVPMMTSSQQMVFIPNRRSIFVWGGVKTEIRPLDYNLLSGKYVNDENGSEKQIGQLLNHWIDSDGLKIDASEVSDEVLSSYLDTSFSVLDLKSDKWETRIHCSYREFEASRLFKWKVENDEHVETIFNCAPSSSKTSHSCIYNDKDNSIYIFGGFSQIVENTLKIYTFNLQSKQWTCYNFKDTMNGNIPSPHLKGQVALYRPLSNSIYVFGGQSLQDDELVSNDCIYVYNCTSTKWEKKIIPKSPILDRSYSSCAYCKKLDSMLVFGGVVNAIGELSNELCQYSFKENQWTTYKYVPSPTLPKTIKAVYGHSVCLIDDRYLFVYGGCEALTIPTPTPQCIVFDVLSQRWYDLSEVLQLFNSVESPLQVPPLNCSSIIFDENSRRIIMYGGHELENGNKSSNTRFLFLLKDGNNNLENLIGKPVLSDVVLETTNSIN